MKVPDKIYVLLDAHTGSLSYTFTNVPCGYESSQDIEYICKNPLLDYFHQRIEELSSPLNGVFGSTERDNCNERISELLLLIDKLNEM